MRSYKNGNLVNTTGFSESSNIFNSELTNIWIGRARGTEGSSRFLKGSIDEPKIYPYARTADQIKQDYNAGLAGMGASQGATVTMGDSSDKWMSDGLIGHWKMDETSWNGTSGEIKDASGNNNNGTSVNGATTGAGKYGNGGSFDGSNDYVNVANSTTTNFGTGSYTVGLWVKPTNTNSTYRGIISKRTNSNYVGWSIYEGVSNKFGIQFASSHSGPYYSLGSDDTFVANNWYYLIFVVDRLNKQLRFYVNGVQQRISVDITNLGNTNNTTPLLIGHEIGINTFPGSIDEVRIYNRALSSDEVDKLYRYAPGPVAHWKMDEGSGTSVVDASGNGNTGTLTNGPTWDNGKVGNALKFDGVDDYVNVGTSLNPYFVRSKGFSFGSWIKTTSVSKDIIANADWDNPWIGFHFGIAASGAVIFELNQNSTQLIRKTTTLTVNDGNWHYVSFVYNGNGFASGVSIYIDGIVAPAITNYDNANGDAISSTNLQIGARDYNLYWDGSLDDVRIYNYARTQEQILEDMNAGNPAITANSQSALVHYKFDENTGTMANNASGSYLTGTISGGTWKSGTSCISGSCVSLDESTGIVSLGSSPLFASDKEITLSTWIQPEKLDSQEEDIIQMIGGTSKVYLRTTPDNKVKFITTTTSDWGANTSTTALEAGKWYHILARFDGKTSDLYINGKKESTDTATGTINWSTSAPSAQIGGLTSGTVGRLKATFDEAKIFQYALSSDDIQTEYGRGSAVSASSSGPVRVGGTLSGANSIYCPPGNTEGNCAGGLDPSPVGEWKFDEGSGTVAKDTSGQNNNGTLTNGPVWVPGKMGRGLKFDGVDDNININTISGGPTGNQTFTFSTWMKKDSALGSGHRRAIAYGGNLGVYCASGSDVQTMIWLGYYNGNINIADCGVATGVTSTSTGNWEYVSFVYDGTQYSLYHNGVYKGSYSRALNIKDTRLMFGDTYHYSNEDYKGFIDDVRIYPYARTPAQIAWDYNQGLPIAHYKMDECQGTSIYDASGNNNHGTWNGSGGGSQTSAGTCQTSGTAWGSGVNGKFESSLNFDGTDDYVSISDNDIFNMSNISISSWIKTNRAIGSTQARIVNHQESTVKAWGLQIFGDGYSGATGGDKIAFHSNNCVSAQNLLSLGSISSGSWYHIVAINDGSKLKIYINGKLDNVSDSLGNNCSSISAPVVIGKTSQESSFYFPGQIDDVRIYNYPLSTEQIKLLYNGGSALKFGE